MKFLDKILDYQNFKTIHKDDYEMLANEIRQYLIDLSNSKEIHLSSNLGIIELSISLLNVFDLNNDYLIYDTGHQAYVHKLLTGRYQHFDTIRSDNGVTGLFDMNESKYDHYSGGHCSNSISVLTGYYLAERNNLKQKHYICVIGDAALANGLAFEALNFVSFNNIPLIIIINDNNMSISINVGSVQKCFKDENKTKHFFNSLDYEYMYINDGHNINNVILKLNEAKKYVELNKKPIIVHIKTIKGKGLVLAQNDRCGLFHSNVLNNKQSFGLIACNKIQSLINNDNNIFILNPAMNIGAGFLDLYNSDYKNYIDVGINESNCISIASGLAIKNKTVYVLFYSTFLQRAYDQLLHDCARLNLNINILLDRSDISGGDGPSHHGIFDVGFLKSMPNTIITSCRNFEQLNQLIDYSYENKKGIFVIRYTKTPCVSKSFNTDFKIKPNQWEWFENKSTNIILISYGPVFDLIYEKINLTNLNINLVNAIWISNYDQKEMKKLFYKYDTIFCYEKIFSDLGLFSDLALYKNKNNLKNKIFGLNYKTIPGNGTNNFVDKQVNMDIDSLIEWIKTNIS